MQITNLDLKTVDDGVVVTLVAVTPTLGYTDVSLTPAVYVTPPIDGIQDLFVHFTPPAGLFGLTSIQLIPLEIELPATDWLRGVRVHVSPGLIGEPKPITLRSLVMDRPPIGQDGLVLSHAGLRDDKVLLDIAYSGGCKPHDFQLSWDGKFLKSKPPAIVLMLSHNANGDECEMFIQERLEFDLSTAEGLELSQIGRIMVKVTGGGSITIPLPFPLVGDAS